ncbi:MAG: ABC transporter permease [Chitinophagaceae bacterium]|nr:ABC transporter permease [Chitinophagaceae bacterium]
MLKNYFKIAVRSFKRNKSFSAINLLGLSVGIAATLLIALYIKDELSYDRFLKNGNNIFQVSLAGDFGGNQFNTYNTPPPVGDAIMNDYPGVKSYTRTFSPGDVLISNDRSSTKKYFTEQNVLAVDSNFLQVFDFSLLQGNAASCLNEPHTIVITKATAEKYFNTDQAIGKVLLFGDSKLPLKVTGILQNIPAQSTLQFDFLVPMSTYKVVSYFSWSWIWLNTNTYVTLSDKLAADEAAVNKMVALFPDMVKRRAGKAFERVGMPMEEFYKKGGYWNFGLKRFTNVHLHSAGIETNTSALGSIRNLYIFGAVAFFIILLACVNFMNLSTARSVNRAKEVGVRKVLGSLKRNLTAQFLVESLLFSFAAAIIALVLVVLALPGFNLLAAKTLSFGLLFSNYIWLGLIVLAILIGLLAGSYPALYLSSFKPIAVLKGKLSKTGAGTIFFRNGLVVFQFAVSVGLIICTTVVFNQLRYTQQKDLGLDKENLLLISNTQRLGTAEKTFRDELSKMNGVLNATISTNVPSAGAFGDRYIPEPSATENNPAKDMSMYSYMVDEAFVPTMDIQLLKGRNFSTAFNDSASVIINETAARQSGWKEPVGQYLMYPGGDETRFKVIAVVKDFNVQSLHSAVTPFALFHHSSKSYTEPASFISVRVKPGQVSQAIASLQAKWKNFSPDTPLDYNFLDARLAAMYKTEQQVGAVFSVFAFLSILVACLGLFGLAAFTAEQRIKEIGIRKVLGASVSGIVSMLSKDFLKLVIIGSVIAFPVAWWAMSKWLEDFSYRVNIGWWVFGLAAIIAMIIAFVTVSSQAIKAAVANPVKSLRTE